MGACFNRRVPLKKSGDCKHSLITGRAPPHKKMTSRRHRKHPDPLKDSEVKGEGGEGRKEENPSLSIQNGNFGGVMGCKKC